MKIADVCIRRPVFAIMMSVALVVLGLFSYKDIGVDLMPRTDQPNVSVNVRLNGASPEEMERLVSIPIEIALNGMPGLEDLRSTSIAGLTDVKCQFSYTTDYWKARQEVINRINALNNLPP